MTGAPPDRRAIITEALRKIDDLTAQLDIAQKGDTEPIAVVGMGCRFPGGADNPAQFWQLLQDGMDGIVRVPPERWDADAFFSDDHSVPGTICSPELAVSSRRGDPMNSMPSSSGSPRVRQRRWIPSSGCCSKSPGRHWKTRASPRRRSGAPKPRSSWE